MHPRHGVQRVGDVTAPGVARDHGVPGDRIPAPRSVEQVAGAAARGGDLRGRGSLLRGAVWYCR